MHAVRKPVMTIKIEQVDIRFTPGGQRLATLYVKDLHGIAFQMWENGPITEAMIDKLMTMEGEAIDITGKLEVMVFKSPFDGPIRRNVFTIEGWKRVDEPATNVPRDKNT